MATDGAARLGQIGQLSSIIGSLSIPIDPYPPLGRAVLGPWSLVTEPGPCTAKRHAAQRHALLRYGEINGSSARALCCVTARRSRSLCTCRACAPAVPQASDHRSKPKKKARPAALNVGVQSGAGLPQAVVGHDWGDRLCLTLPPRVARHRLNPEPRKAQLDRPGSRPHFRSWTCRDAMCSFHLTYLLNMMTESNIDG